MHGSRILGCDPKSGSASSRKESDGRDILLIASSKALASNSVIACFIGASLLRFLAKGGESSREHRSIKRVPFLEKLEWNSTDLSRNVTILFTGGTRTPDATLARVGKLEMHTTVLD